MQFETVSRIDTTVPDMGNRVIDMDLLTIGLMHAAIRKSEENSDIERNIKETLTSNGHGDFLKRREVGRRGLHLRMDEMVFNGQFEKALFQCSDYVRPAYVAIWWDNGLMNEVELRETLAFAWTSCHYPSRVLGLRWSVEVFKAAGQFSDDPSVELPTGDLVIYRGCEPVEYFDLAWTTDYRMARQFARRHSPQAVVFRSEIPPHHVLAMLSQREEGEVVINPWGLPRSKIREVG